MSESIFSLSFKVSSFSVTELGKTKGDKKLQWSNVLVRILLNSITNKRVERSKLAIGKAI